MTIQPLIFYDIPGNAWANKAWSPNCWKGRYALNIKGVPYKTVWLEYEEIEDALKKAGVEATGTRAGKPLYTCPALVDPNTGTAIADSLVIAEYLEKTYPDASKPTLFPPGTRTLQLGFRDLFEQRVKLNIQKCILLAIVGHLSPESSAYWRRTREEHRYKVALEDVAPPGEKRDAMLRSIVDGLHAMGGWIDAGDKGPFLTGKEPCFADVDIAATLVWVRLLVGKEEDGLWATIAKLDGGRWVKYMEDFGKWEACP